MIEPKSLPAERTTAASWQTFGGFDRPFARISWGSIFAGAIIALATQVVLTLIGMAIGLATISPARGNTPSGTALGLGATIWLLISSLISLFIGGYIAGRLGGTFNGWLHGLATWGVVTLGTIMLLTTAAGGLIGAASGLAAFTAQNSSQVQLPPAVQQQLDQLKAQVNQSADQAVAQAQAPDAQTQADLKKAGRRAAKGGAVGTGGAALALILGALAAAFGGNTGQRYPVREVYETTSTRRVDTTIAPEQP
jgi:hypothetical protein